jgi:hypothetical protein
MPGGNAHQRAIQKTISKEISKQVSEMVPSTSRLDPIPKPRFRWDFTLFFAGTIMAILIVLFPPDTKIGAACWLIGIFVMTIYPSLHLADWLSFGNKYRMLLSAVFLVIAVSAVTGIGLKIWPPDSQLSMNSIATNLSYGEGTMHAGIAWQTGYNDLRLIIKNPEPSVQNLDLTVQMDKTLIFQMGQLSSIPACEFYSEEFPPDVGARLRTKTGRSIFISLKDMMRMAGKAASALPNLTQAWRVYCPRLIGHGELELVLAVPPQLNDYQVNVFGNYQLPPIEGNKSVRVNERVRIRK